MGYTSACPNGTQLHLCHDVPCCTNSTSVTCNGPYPSDPCSPDDSKSTILNHTYVINYCLISQGLLVCNSSVDCHEHDDDLYSGPCSQKPAEQSFHLLTGTDTQATAFSTSSASTSPPTRQSLATAGVADSPGAQNPTVRTSLSTSGPAATSTGQQDFQNNRAASKSNTAAVAGGIAGGIIGLTLLLAVLAICYRRRTTRALKGIDQGKLLKLGSSQARAVASGGAELEEIKPGPSPTTSLLHPPSSWPLPPPPGYTPYRSQGHELDRSQPNVSQPSANSPHTSDTHPTPESPPSPPPLNTRSSQDSADNNTETQSVSPISSHYQSHPFDESEDLKASVYSEVSSNDLFHTQNKRS